MNKKLKKMDMRGILDLAEYESAIIVSEREFVQKNFRGNMSLYAMMSGRNRTTLKKRKAEVERLVIEYRGKFIQVDVKAEIHLGE